MTQAITVENLTKSYGSGEDALAVLENLSFGVDDGEFVALLGPSGCGKTTILKLLAGIGNDYQGSIRVHDDPITGPSGDVAMVFQQYALLPWKTVVDNVALPLVLQGKEGTAARTAAVDWLTRVGLDGFEASYPEELSGGMKQRVGLARALAADPDVLLMDEPFGALDYQTKSELQTKLLELWETEAKTILYITHDLEEALYLADRVLLLSCRPTSITREIAVPFDRPRRSRRVEIEGSAEFQELKRILRSELGLST
ncbi:ABC transporter ATP-binding protein [Natranaeroarchaeum sulfidigenes]|uniref:ABC-type nitrate/sulfonate/bicarbonate transportsystem, ATPase component n=1 Tax=Natranaeroarchaeum sulfidigenes TaxID=2784880 RepID=A0A897MNC2_9EURY|nr:ABC transporter ATP-binding protein [Natranaeroarchaeum sulfidigenes]QSG01861.1 ABC-type nitrate/sulfonate/bicarbonate transportsystem, ATPase component [Natranaeroarchaeum sulfidigenes]